MSEPAVDPAEVIARLKSGVRRRLSEVAAAGEASDDLRRRLAHLRAGEYVREPRPFSHRRGLGQTIVLVRRVVYKLFGRWTVRPILEQQNQFNQAAVRLLQDLAEADAIGRRRAAQLEGRLLAAEDRLAALEGERRSHVSPA
jgi:hypothetical protein